MREMSTSSLPNEVIIADLETTLDESQRHVEIDERLIFVSDKTHEILAISAHVYTRPDIGMGDHFRVLVAVGGVATVSHGIVTPRRCFATLWYSPEGHLITVDFSRGMP
jgi:hypothetical protein